MNLSQVGGLDLNLVSFTKACPSDFTECVYSNVADESARRKVDTTRPFYFILPDWNKATPRDLGPLFENSTVVFSTVSNPKGRFPSVG